PSLAGGAKRSVPPIFTPNEIPAEGPARCAFAHLHIRNLRMTAAPVIDSDPYEPPKVWTWDKESGGCFASINRPIAGPTHDKELPIGRHPLQLYSLATPNG